MDKNTGYSYSIPMDRPDWIAACAHALQCRWRTVDPEVLEDVAADLWAMESMRILPPLVAARDWLEPVTPPPPADPVRGILGHIPGDWVSRGAKGLPTPGPADTEPRRVVLEVPVFGRVCLSYRATQGRHRGRASHWFWCAVRAEPI
ncbi:hypothetical protein E5CHR_02925 [Variovorax sp. PBL-E5]|nr:hypothetical protein E5CHR_02925 [Variovorax sp. PBL-E5]